MTITILGEHISMIRKVVPKPARVYKDELPYIRHHCKSRTVKEHTGRVVSICIKLKNEAIRGWHDTSKMHIDVIKLFDISPEDVADVGWQLENGNYVWSNRKAKTV